MSNSEVTRKISELLDLCSPMEHILALRKARAPHLTRGNSVWVNSMGAFVIGPSTNLYNRGLARLVPVVYRAQDSRRRSAGSFNAVTYI